MATAHRCWRRRRVSDESARESRIVVVVRGRVQGVGYRWFVRREAERRGVRGWVANLPDGGVEVVAEADERVLDAFVERLRDGPPGASVRDVEVRTEPPRGGLGTFEIRSGAHRGD